MRANWSRFLSCSAPFGGRTALSRDLLGAAVCRFHSLFRFHSPHKYCIPPSSLSLSPFPSCTSIPWTIDVVSFQGNPIPRTKVKCRRLDANRTIGNPLSHASVVTGSCAPNTSSLLNNIMDQGRSTGAQQPDGLRERIVSPSDSTPGPDTLAAHGEAEIKDGDGKDKKTFGRTPDGTGRFDFISSVLILFHPVSFLS